VDRRSKITELASDPQEAPVVIGLDTNVLVRWLVSPDQADLASSDVELERVGKIVSAEGASLFVNAVVIAETAWIMERKLDLSREVVSAVINRLLFAENIKLGNDLEMRAALMLYALSNIGFADCLIAELNLAAGCMHTLTFDRKASRTAGFRHVEDH
jgi:predicted nucleic-acid-binding protein